MVQTQIAPAPVSPRADAKPKLDVIPDLYYYPDTARLRTPFRDSAIEFIYRTALEVDDGRLKYGCVYVYTLRIENDRETLDLVLIADADWERIANLQRKILNEICECMKSLTEEQKTDFNRRIAFGYFPAS